MEDKSLQGIIRNYIMLYQAIIFSDYDDGKGKAVAVYDTKEKYRLVAIFNNMKTCAMFFNTTVNRISHNARLGALIKNRFAVEKFDIEPTSTKAEYTKIIMDKQLRNMTGRLGYKKIFWR